MEKIYFSSSNFAFGTKDRITKIWTTIFGSWYVKEIYITVATLKKLPTSKHSCSFFSITCIQIYADLDSYVVLFRPNLNEKCTCFYMESR